MRQFVTNVKKLGNSGRTGGRLCLSVILAFFNAVCTQAVTAHACFGWDAVERAGWLLIFLGGILPVWLFFAVLDYLGDRCTAGDPGGPRWLPVLFFVCWLPYLLVYLPGLLNYDTVNQVQDFLDGVAPVPFGYAPGQEEITVWFNNHHPVFLSIIFGVFFRLGILLGHPSFGLTLYILLQMAAAAWIFAWAIRETGTFWRIGSRLLRNAVIAFFALCPVIPYYICIMLKNSVHSLVMVLYVCLYLKIALGDHVLSRGERGLWAVTVLLLPLTQHTGLYFVILTGIPLILWGRKENRRAVTAVLAGAALLMLLLTRAVFPALNIFPGGKQEVLSTFIQQTARYIRDHEDEVTEEEKEVISAVLDYEVLRDGFEFYSTDPVKATYHLHATKAERNAYLKVWARQGLRHPGAYFRATLPICGQFFALGYDVAIFDHIPSDSGIFAEIRHVMPESVRATFTGWYEWLRALPGIDLLFQHVLYTLWIPVYCLSGVIRTGRRKVLFITPFLVNAVFLIASPVIYSRYALPLLFTAPILLYTVLGQGAEPADREDASAG